MSINFLNKIILSTAFVAIAGASAAQAMEPTTGDTMMKKDDTAMMKKEEDGAMMKKEDAMMSVTKDLFLGLRGEDVVALQTFLETKGLLVMPAGVSKGYFGPLTKSALMKYQTSVGVKSTGYFGPLTRAAMSSMMKKDDAAMMKKEEDGAMMKKEDAAMEKKDEGAMMKK